jgi:hypothetical protein
MKKYNKGKKGMEIFLDCLPCMLRQVIDASRMATESTKLHEKIVEEAINLLGNYKKYRNSPEVGREMHWLVKNFTGVMDPYKETKKKDIQTALKLYPYLKQFVNEKNDRIYWALKTAAVGNVIDTAINAGLDIEGCVKAELDKRFAVCDLVRFKHRLEKAKSLLVIGDNAGETVFDRVFLEELQNIDITYAVRSAPIINDAVVEDAYASGLDRCARVVSAGCDVPGVVLDRCSQAFMDVFHTADIVVSKGQGNYETLSDCGRDVYFLLKAKCTVLSGVLDVGLNEYVFKYKGKMQ